MSIKRGFRAVLLLTAASLLVFSACGAKMQMKKQKAGNIETVIAEKGGQVMYKLVYTYEGDKIVSGEYWEPAAPKDKSEKPKPKTNIFSNSGFAKGFEKLLTGKKVIDDSDIKLDVEKDSYILKFVKKVKYNAEGLPVKVVERGYTEFPFVGFFNIKTDKSYKYTNGKLSQIVEKNINVDTLLLNMAIGNVTDITRDATGRPVKVQKGIGSVPPVIETTDYTYYGKSNNMLSTVYKKAGLDLKKLKVVPEKTITFYYGPNVPWDGKVKYNMLAAFEGFLIFNDVEKKNELDLKNFKKMNMVEKAKVMAKVYELVKNEMKGPKWRMGELPDVPEPFLLYGDQTWW
jgi:hypothetical protein